MSGTWNHFDREGNAVMVDVSEKGTTIRTASAAGVIRVNREILRAVMQKTAAKGDVLGVARVAGIMAAKRTWELIPLCHPIRLRKCAVDFETAEERTAVSTALLTIYDMCKAVDKRMEITGIHLLSKTGGKSGDFQYD